MSDHFRGVPLREPQPLPQAWPLKELAKLTWQAIGLRLIRVKVRSGDVFEVCL